VTAGGKRMPMKDPFFVLATQNPIEQEGTYPLPEAQQDRFMFKIFVKYPSWDEEFNIIRVTTAAGLHEPVPILDAATVIRLQGLIRRVPAADHVIQYAMRLVRATRVSEADIPTFVRDYVSWGAGPRACQDLVLGGKARAVLQGRYHVSTEDVQAVAKPVLRHRLITNFNADAEGVTPDALVDRLIASIPAKEGAIAADERTSKVLK
jgi:MoxR-like ATPase